MSKLQALAAARKKKAQEQRNGTAEVIEKPMAGLSLQNREGQPKSETGVMDSSTTSKHPARGFPLRKRKDSNPHEKIPKTPLPKSKDPEKEDAQIEIAPVDQAEPSDFANTMFSTITHPIIATTSLFTLPYVANATNLTDPFSGPSPDDIVLAAQSKGSAMSGKPKK